MSCKKKTFSNSESTCCDLLTCLQLKFATTEGIDWYGGGYQKECRAEWDTGEEKRTSRSQERRVSNGRVSNVRLSTCELKKKNAVNETIHSFPEMAK